MRAKAYKHLHVARTVRSGQTTHRETESDHTKRDRVRPLTESQS